MEGLEGVTVRSEKRSARRFMYGLIILSIDLIRPLLNSLGLASNSLDLKHGVLRGQVCVSQIFIRC